MTVASTTHVSHAIDLGTRMKGMLRGIRPLGREVDRIVDDAATFRSRVTAINRELQQRPPYDEVTSLGRADWRDGMTGVILRDEFADRSALIDDLRAMDKASRRLYDRGERLERSIAVRHPELVTHHQWQEESLGSLFGGLLGNRTYSQSTRTARTYPAEIRSFRSAEQLAVSDLRDVTRGVSTPNGREQVDAILFRVPTSRSLDSLDQAIDGVRALARELGEPARR